VWAPQYTWPSTDEDPVASAFGNVTAYEVFERHHRFSKAGEWVGYDTHNPSPEVFAGQWSYEHPRAQLDYSKHSDWYADDVNQCIDFEVATRTAAAHATFNPSANPSVKKCSVCVNNNDGGCQDGVLSLCEDPLRFNESYPPCCSCYGANTIVTSQLTQPAAPAWLGRADVTAVTPQTDSITLAWALVHGVPFNTGGDLDKNIEYELYGDKVDGDQPNNLLNGHTVTSNAPYVDSHWRVGGVPQDARQPGGLALNFTVTNLTAGDLWHWKIRAKNRGSCHNNMCYSAFMRAALRVEIPPSDATVNMTRPEIYSVSDAPEIVLKWVSQPNSNRHTRYRVQARSNYNHQHFDAQHNPSTPFIHEFTVDSTATPAQGGDVLNTGSFVGIFMNNNAQKFEPAQDIAFKVNRDINFPAMLPRVKYEFRIRAESSEWATQDEARHEALVAGAWSAWSSANDGAGFTVRAPVAVVTDSFRRADMLNGSMNHLLQDTVNRLEWSFDYNNGNVNTGGDEDKYVWFRLTGQCVDNCAPTTPDLLTDIFPTNEAELCKPNGDSAVLADASCDYNAAFNASLVAGVRTFSYNHTTTAGHGWDYQLVVRNRGKLTSPQATPFNGASQKRAIGCPL
jgi:hypothetical protein